MCKFSKVFLSAFAVLALAIFPTAYATHDLGLFELEDNAVQNGGLPGAEDWQTLYDNGNNTGGSSVAFTGVIPDPQGGDNIFEGGKKDIQDLDKWSWKTTGGFPDKNDITNAYAAAYNDDGDLIIYFGADRFSNDGDAFLGFWFFKQQVKAVNGKFTGLHTYGDTLVLVNFPQASNASPEIKVVIWDPSCTKAASNNPLNGECDAKNIRLINKTSATCGDAPGDLFCALTNDEGAAPNNGARVSPWPYVPKSGPAGIFPFESFFEGGINITDLIGGDTCFSSFLAETRSSKEFTATLKDFVLGDFEVCSIAANKVCLPPAIIDPDDNASILSDF